MSQPIPEQPDAQPQPNNAQIAILQSWMQQSQEIVLKWLYDVGGWIFTGLIVLALMILMNMLNAGTGDGKLLTAGVLLSIALPLELAGLWITRYLQNREQAQLAAMNLPSFPGRQRTFTRGMLGSLFGLSVLLSLVGVILTLWHISWATGLFFLLALIVGVALTFWVLGYKG